MRTQISPHHYTGPVLRVHTSADVSPRVLPNVLRSARRMWLCVCS